jgi:protein-tyrosine phosphatase
MITVRGFVDVHSHMVPSRDDGVQSRAEGIALLEETARRGTAVQYATPHANEQRPWTAERSAATRAAHEAMAAEVAACGLDLRLGVELSAEPWLLEADPRELRLGPLRACLLEFPLPHTGIRDARMLVACAEHIEAAGLTPILAHPERSAPVHDDPGIARAMRERGWLLQVNASSLLGQDGDRNRRTGWLLVERGDCDLVASDGHRRSRPPYLDAVAAELAGRIGEEAAARLVCGHALAGLGESEAHAAA